ncbi:unnamed protein product [Coregonus sp. 'balchen']|nr:unnamed protein product [Coregonus sp. 'balchen']
MLPRKQIWLNVNNAVPKQIWLNVNNAVPKQIWLNVNNAVPKQIWLNVNNAVPKQIWLNVNNAVPKQIWLNVNNAVPKQIWLNVNNAVPKQIWLNESDSDLDADDESDKSDKKYDETESTDTYTLPTNQVLDPATLASPDLLSEVSDVKHDLIKMSAILTTEQTEHPSSSDRGRGGGRGGGRTGMEEEPREPFEIMEQVKEDLEKVGEILRGGDTRFTNNKENVLQMSELEDEEWVLLSQTKAKAMTPSEVQEPVLQEVSIQRKTSSTVTKEVRDMSGMVSHLSGEMNQHLEERPAITSGPPQDSIVQERFDQVDLKREGKRHPPEIKKPIRKKLRDRERSGCSSSEGELERMSSEESLDGDISGPSGPTPAMEPPVSPLVVETPIGSIKDRVRALQKKVEEEEEGEDGRKRKPAQAPVPQTTTFFTITKETGESQMPDLPKLPRSPKSPRSQTERLEETMSVRELMKAFQTGQDPSKNKTGLFEHKAMTSSTTSTSGSEAESATNINRIQPEDRGIPLDRALPKDGGILLDRALPEDGGILLDRALPEDGGILLDRALPEDGGILLDRALPEDGRILLYKAQPEDGGILLERAQPEDGGILVDRALPEDGGILLSRAQPEDGGILLDRTLPEDGGILLDRALPEDGGILLDRALPEDGGILLDRALPENEGILVDRALPEDGGILLDRALPEKGGILLDRVLPEDGGILLDRALPDDGGSSPEMMQLEEPEMGPDRMPSIEIMQLEESEVGPDRRPSIERMKLEEPEMGPDRRPSIEMQISPDRKPSEDFSSDIKAELEDSPEYQLFRQTSSTGDDNHPQAEAAKEELPADHPNDNPTFMFSHSMNDDGRDELFTKAENLVGDESPVSLKHEGAADSPGTSVGTRTTHSSTGESEKHEGLADTPQMSPLTFPTQEIDMPTADKETEIMDGKKVLGDVIHG